MASSLEPSIGWGCAGAALRGRLDAMDVTQGGSGGRNAWLTVAYAAAKVLLQKFSSLALEEGRRGIGLSIVRGILGGLNFIAGGASSVHLMLALSSRTARLGQASWTIGVGVVYWLLLHICGRRLTKP